MLGRDSLQQIADDHWDYLLDRVIGYRTKFGLPIERLPDLTYAQTERDADVARGFLRRLDAIEPANDEERITAAMLRWQNEYAVNELTAFWYRSPVTPNTTQLRIVGEAFASMKRESDEYRALAEQYPRFVDGIVSVLREQEARGFLLPKDDIPIVRAMLESYLGEFPAVQRLLDFFDADYVAHAPEAIGMWQYPGGAEAYRTFVREETTTSLTPEEIHELGLREMARLNGELEAVRQRIGFGGTLSELVRFFKRDSRFLAQTPEEVEGRLMAVLRRIEPQMPRFFACMTKAPCDVKRLDPRFEASITFGYFQPPTAADPVGHYYFNGSKLGERNLLSASTLMAHELLPGHHYQTARQEENASLPMFRRQTFESAYAEGWAEYAAGLGAEMGLYDDPYDLAGRLMMDMFLSTRLVVDSGLNALGWSRQRAMEMLRENTMLSETEIESETLRYGVEMPAQALSYKIGSAKMLELRALAERKLGARFDIRQFHEWMIGSGSMPLAVLEEHVRRAISAARGVAC